MTLHGVSIETGDDSAMLEMAECFIDEYARLGFDANRILHLFNTRGYAGPFMAATVLGNERIRGLVAAVLARRGERRAPALGRTTEKRGIGLTVLNG
jgi:hypothetical protein